MARGARRRADLPRIYNALTMASKRIRYLISYDIANAKRLRRVAKTLESYGTRLQFSVFECPLDELRVALEGNAASSTAEQFGESYRMVAAVAERLTAASP